MVEDSGYLAAISGNKKENAPDVLEQSSESAIGKYSVWQDTYDGEKLDGDLGAPVEYALDHEAMAARAWQAFVDSDFVSIVLDRYLEWIIGSGLTLQSTPDFKVIESEGVVITQDDLRKFSSVAESRFRLWANDRMSDYKKQDNLHKLSIEIEKNVFLTGDCVVIYRIDDKGLINVDFINGQNIKTPVGENIKAGNVVVQGVEVNKRGQHIAYWVQTSAFEYKRIAALDSFGRLRAEMVYWKKAKKSDVRGLSGLHASFQKMRNLDRFSEATIQAAVTQANLAYFVTTDKDAMTIPTPGLRGTNTAKLSTPDINMGSVARKVYADTAKTIHELPPGKQIEMPDIKGRSEVDGFMSTYFQYFCSGLGVPPEVAIQLYTNSFSASRMATKSFEHTIRVKRSYFNVYKNAYKLFVDVQVSAKKIDQPQLKQAIFDENNFLIAAFAKCKLIGANVPHADPVKEAKAHRILLGDDDVPLETLSTATESLGTGDAGEIVDTRKREMQEEGDFKTEETSINTTGNE